MEGWHPIDEPPEEPGVYIVFAASADPDKPLKVATWYDPVDGWFEIIPYWRKALSHWIEMPPDPHPHPTRSISTKS